MAVIDDKVVAMSFESSKFESGVNNTISALDRLKASLKLPAASKGIDDVGAAAKRIDLSHIGRSLDSIREKLTYFSVSTLAIFANVAMGAARAGAQIVKSLTIDPILSGYKEYATNLNSIQTILANTQAAGTDLKDVTGALDELNRYSDKTIYNFSQMARNIGTFTAAGVALEPATAAIKGIANLAALSGSNAEQASTAMYQLSQALAAGRVTLMDWNSVVNAGMGGTVFQRALAQTAEAMGTLEKGAVKLTGPMKNVTVNGEAFRASLSAKPGEESWLTSKVLTNTLKQFTSDLSDAELKAMGFNQAQIKAIQQTAKTAMFAATEVKTLSQVLDVAKETAQSGWAKTWQIIFGDFGEAKKTFTNLSNAINDFINKNADARNKVLQDWKDMGGRENAIWAIKEAFQNLGEIIKPIKEAFRDVFPPITGLTLANLTTKLMEFAVALKPSAQTVENLKSTFRGLFAILSIGRQIVSGIFSVFGKLFGAVSDGSGGFLKFTASVGDYIYNLDKALKKSGAIEKVFSSIGNALAVPVKLIQMFVRAIGELFGVFSSGGLGGEIDGASKSLIVFESVMSKINKGFDKLIDKVSEFGGILGPIIEAYAEALKLIPQLIGDAVSNMNFEAILAVVRTGLFAGLVLMLKNFFGKGSFVDQLGAGFKGLSGGIIQNIAGSFGALQGSMVAMQNSIKAKTLKDIAIAILLLAAAVLALSLVNPERLNASIGAIAILMGELIGALALLEKVSQMGGFLKLPFIVAGLIGLAIAIDLLVIAVLALSRLSWDELIKGLVGVGGLLGGIAASVGVLSANSAGMIRVGIGLTAIAIALNLMALAVRQLGTMDLAELAKGLGGIAISIGIMVVAVNKMNSAGMIKMGVGLVALGIALNLIALAVRQLGTMSMSELAKGLGAVAVSLGIMVAAVAIMSKIKNLQIAALGLIGLGIALNLVAQAVKSMGGMSMEAIAKGLIGLGGALVILAIGLKVLSGSLTGAASLGIAALGITLLVQAIKTLGGMSWGTILKGLGSLAAVLAVVSIAAIAMGAATAPTLAFSVALLAIGAAVALVGAGIFLIATGLAALAVALPSALGIMGQAIAEFQKALIENAKLIALGVLEVVRAFSDAAPQFVAALIKILNSLIDGIIQMSPKIVELFNALIEMILQVLADNQGKIIQAGFDLLIALLQGIKDNLPTIVTMVADIIVLFIQSLTNNLGRIITAGKDLLIKFISGIISLITMVPTTVLQLLTRFVQAVTSNIGLVVTAGITLIIRFIKAIADKVGELIKVGALAIVEFIKGITDAARDIVKAARESAAKFMNTLAEEIPKFADDVFKALIKLINGMATTIDNNAPQLRAAGVNLGWAIINGMTGGLTDAAQNLYNKIGEIMNKAKGMIDKVWVFGSPSKVTKDMGKWIMDGLYIGISNNGKAPIGAAEEMSRLVIGKFAEVFQTYSPSKVMKDIGQYVAQGFAEGLRGGKDDIVNAFSELNDKLTEAMTTARETIDSEQKKLKELREADKPDVEAIKAAQKVIAQNQQLLKMSTEAQKFLNQELKLEKQYMIQLANQYTEVSNKLAKAEEGLAQARQRRDEAAKNWTDQYQTLPDLTGDPEMTGEEQLANYQKALQDQVNAVAAYSATLDQLRALGLDDQTYQKLLDEGTANQKFAEALLAGGKTAVDGLNALDKQLKAEATKLGNNGAKNLYQAGVDAAKGIVKGFRSQLDELKAEAEAMADAINAAFRARLKLKSPSRVFMEIGALLMEGLAIGISKSTASVVSTVEAAADSAINAMKNTMRKASDAVSATMDTNPVITPILDLSLVRGQIGSLRAMTNVTPITAAVSYGQASMISAEQFAQMEEMVAASSFGPSIKYEQNNYSPKALSEIEIYRQTKNQLSQVKAILDIA